MKSKNNDFQKWRWAVRVFNTLLIAAFVLVIVFNAKEMPAWLIVLISIASIMFLSGGRIFCGYFCTVGLVLDSCWWLSKKLHVRSLKRSEKFNRFIRWFKWLFLVLYTVVHFVLGFDPGWILVVLLVVTAPFIARFWCSFCPVGTLLGQLNRFSPMKLTKSTGGCISCSSCYHNCPMQSKKLFSQRKDGPTNGSDCIFCGECIGLCPGEGTVSLRLFGRTIYQSRRRNHARKGGIPTAAGVGNALGNVYEIIQETPCWHASRLSEKYGCNLYLKREDRQKVRSYKIRGAYNKIKSLSEEDLEKGVVCASAGNHAQGVAYSCSKLGIKGYIFMPVTTPGQKIDSVRYFGKDNIEIRLSGETFDEAASAAKAFAAEGGLTFIPPFDDPEVIEGQGTVAYEIIESLKKRNVTLDYVFVPIGGGGLASGVGLYFKHASPTTKVIGVEPSGAASMKAAFAEGHPVTLEHIDTFVDGAAVARAGNITYKVCRQVLDDIIVVPESDVCRAMLDIYNSKGIVLEPAGALSLAALDFCREMIAGRNVCCILSGSNNDAARIAEIQRRAENKTI